MKNFLILTIVAMLALTACQKVDGKVELEDGAELIVRHFKYRNHDYIEFTRDGGNLYDNHTGVEHDPDCMKRDIKAILDSILLEAHKQ